MQSIMHLYLITFDHFQKILHTILFFMLLMRFLNFRLGFYCLFPSTDDLNVMSIQSVCWLMNTRDMSEVSHAL